MGKDAALTDEQKEFISANYKTMSDRSIARKFGVSRKIVNEYRKDILSGKIDIKLPKRYNPQLEFFIAKITPIITIIVFIAILILALDLRKYTFNTPHLRGDEHHYVGLALKLDKKGIAGYNLRGINMYGDKRSPYLIQLGLIDDKGDILKGLAEKNIFYYDEPLHHIPFGFPMAIMLSHRIFAGKEPYYILHIPNVREYLKKTLPGIGLRDFRFEPTVRNKQFYSIVIPLSFSIFLIILTYLLAKQFYNNEIVALTAMFLMTISPIDIMASQKIWADDMTAALTALAALLYIMAVNKNKPILAFIGGISCGLSALTKQSGAFIAFVVIIWHFATNIDRLFKRETFFKTIFDKNLILFGIGAILSSGYWFAKVMSVYGNPIYQPHQKNIGKLPGQGWFELVGKRPRYVYLIGIPFQNPLFGLSYISFLWLLKDRKQSKNTAFLITWILVFLYIFSIYLGKGGKEHRYMLPSYTAFAILGAYVADKIRIFIDKRTENGLGTFSLIIILIISAFWSIPMGLRAVFYEMAVIMKPF